MGGEVKCKSQRKEELITRDRCRVFLRNGCTKEQFCDVVEELAPGAEVMSGR